MTTLPANTYYRLGDRYFDSVANVEYICTTPGTNATSIWSTLGTFLLNITGEYDPARTYSLMQIAIISMGDNAGTYVYINSAPSSGNAPYAGGGYWFQIAVL